MGYDANDTNEAHNFGFLRFEKDKVGSFDDPDDLINAGRFEIQGGMGPRMTGEHYRARDAIKQRMKDLFTCVKHDNVEHCINGGGRRRSGQNEEKHDPKIKGKCMNFFGKNSRYPSCPSLSDCCYNEFSACPDHKCLGTCYGWTVPWKQACDGKHYYPPAANWYLSQNQFKVTNANWLPQKCRGWKNTQRNPFSMPCANEKTVR